MDKELQELHQIRGSRETFNALVKWINDGNVKTIIPRPLEYGVLLLDEKEYVLFDRNDDIVRYAWFRNDETYARFEYDLENYELDNIGTVEKLEPSEALYQSFFYITSAYCAAMSFIIANIENKEAVKVSHNGDQRIYELNLENVELKEMTVQDSAKGQVFHHLTLGKHA